MRQDSTVARALAAEYLLDPRGLSPRVVIDELMSTLAARDAEIERLRKLIDDAGKPWILLDPGVPWEGAIDAAMAAACGEIKRLRALVEQRGYAMSMARQRIAEWHDLIESEADLDDSAGDAISVRDVVLKEMEETRAGLLAAIDEATEEAK